MPLNDKGFFPVTLFLDSRICIHVKIDQYCRTWVPDDAPIKMIYNTNRFLGPRGSFIPTTTTTTKQHLDPAELYELAGKKKRVERAVITVTNSPESIYALLQFHIFFQELLKRFEEAQQTK